MSADNLATLKDFSVKECRSAFPVASATPETQKAYDVAWAAHPGVTTRTSYVIDKNGKIVMVHDDLDFSQHVAKTLAAVQGAFRQGTLSPQPRVNVADMWRSLSVRYSPALRPRASTRGKRMIFRKTMLIAGAVVALAACNKKSPTEQCCRAGAGERRQSGRQCDRGRQ